jgi:hypothetical protein
MEPLLPKGGVRASATEMDQATVDRRHTVPSPHRHPVAHIPQEHGPWSWAYGR